MFELFLIKSLIVFFSLDLFLNKSLVFLESSVLSFLFFVFNNKKGKIILKVIFCIWGSCFLVNRKYVCLWV